MLTITPNFNAPKVNHQPSQSPKNQPSFGISFETSHLLRDNFAKQKKLYGFLDLLELKSKQYMEIHDTIKLGVGSISMKSMESIKHKSIMVSEMNLSEINKAIDKCV